MPYGSKKSKKMYPLKLDLLSKFSKKADTVKKIAKKEVKKALNNNLEKRYLSQSDTFMVHNGVSSSNRINLTNTYGTGTNQGYRNGDSINLRSIRVRGGIVLDPRSGTGAGTNIGSTFIRILVLQWLVDDDVIPPIDSDIFESTTYEWCSGFLQRADKRANYAVLYDKRITLSALYNPDPLNPHCLTTGAYQFDINLTKFVNRKVTYTATTAGAFGRNKVFFIVLSDNASGVAPTCKVTYHFDQHYTDA